MMTKRRLEALGVRGCCTKDMCDLGLLNYLPITVGNATDADGMVNCVRSAAPSGWESRVLGCASACNTGRAAPACPGPASPRHPSIRVVRCGSAAKLPSAVRVDRDWAMRLARLRSRQRIKPMRGLSPG